MASKRVAHTLVTPHLARDLEQMLDLLSAGEYHGIGVAFAHRDDRPLQWSEVFRQLPRIHRSGLHPCAACLQAADELGMRPPIFLYPHPATRERDGLERREQLAPSVGLGS